MMILTLTRCRRLEMQGFDPSEPGFREVVRWLRIMPAFCSLGALAAGWLESAALAFLLAALSIPAAMTGRHPVDYLYAGLVRRLTGGVELPRNHGPRRVGCVIAALFLTASGVLMDRGAAGPGAVLAFIVTLSAALPALFDLCIPAGVYGLIQRWRSRHFAGGRPRVPSYRPSFSYGARRRITLPVRMLSYLTPQESVARFSQNSRERVAG